MGMAGSPRIHVMLLPLFFIGISTLASATTLFILTNECSYTVWPATLSGDGAISGDGVFALLPGDTSEFQSQAGWSGLIWARTACVFDINDGNSHCLTGDCDGKLNCTVTAAPPFTQAEFAIGSAGDKDVYDVSLVDGYNVGLSVRPTGGSGNCLTRGCATDINAICPRELQVVDVGGAVVACKRSATSYSEIFENACPKASNNPYDHKTSSCSFPDYFITFCPSNVN
ncbi:hypothetical protein DH2020_049169 [Rehmannia glutinosa]|uniref:Thaumatin-like protein n=1 Tax=Rehmannia glutinosa TaxID=99300 RepID=A0ABR0U3S6_REHGL